MLQRYYRRLHRWSFWILWSGIVLSFYGNLMTILPMSRALEWLFHIETSNASGMVLILMVSLVTPTVILTHVTEWRLMLILTILAEGGVWYFGLRVIESILVRTTHHGVIAGFIPKLSIYTPWATLYHSEVVLLLLTASMILVGGFFTIVASCIQLMPPRAAPVYDTQLYDG